MKVWCPYDMLQLITQITPNPANENVHTEEQIKRLAEILEYQGFRKPLIISKRSKYLVTGHGTLEAAKLNGWQACPVSYQDFESDEQETAHRIADNALSTWSHLDLSKVNLLIPDLDPAFDLDMFGIKNFELEPADKPERGCPQCGYIKIK